MHACMHSCVRDCVPEGMHACVCAHIYTLHSNSSRVVRDGCPVLQLLGVPVALLLNGLHDLTVSLAPYGPLLNHIPHPSTAHGSDDMAHWEGGKGRGEGKGKRGERGERREEEREEDGRGGEGREGVSHTPSITLYNILH